MTALYELANEFKGVALALADEPDAEVVADTLEGLAMPVKEKALQVARFIQNIEVEAQAIKDAEASMAARRKVLENKAKSIREYLKHNMEQAGIDRISCPFFTLAVKKCPPSLVIDNEAEIIGIFTVEKTVTSVDKVALKTFLKTGVLLDCAHLSTSTRLEIK